MAAPFRLQLARFILGSKAKEFIPALSMFDGSGGYGTDATGRLKQYATKPEQLSANIGWCFAANNAIVDPTAAVNLKLFRKAKDGKREEIIEHELLDLLDAPNLAHTGEQLRHLHFTYMNYVGESYIYMRGIDGNEYIPTKGKLPAAMEIFPAHLVQFTLGTTYTASTVRYASDTYPLMAFIRDLNPDPAQPYFGRSIVRAAALTLDTETQMKQWNRSVFANSARPSLIFSTNESLSDESYQRWKQQFTGENTGTENAHKPLLIEGGDAKPYMMSPQDLDFLASRQFSMKEILSMWRVSPGMLGQLDNANRSNLDAAFYINAVMNVKPRIRQFVKQLNASLVSVYDPTLELDFEDPVPDDVTTKLAAATAGVDKWWTKDEVREQYGDKPLPDELGAQIYMPNTNAPLESIADGSAKPVPVAPLPSPGAAPDDSDPGSKSANSLAGVKKKDLTPEQAEAQRAQRGNAKKVRADQTAGGFEQRMVAVMAEQFNSQKAQILTNLDTARIGKGYGRGVQKQTYTRKDWLQDLLDWLQAATSFKAAIQPIVHATLLQAGQDAIQEVGLDPSQFDPFTPAIVEYFQNRSMKIAKDVTDETEKQLRASLSQGVVAGESTYELRARVETVMGSASTVRADRIAQTEVSRAQGYGDIAAWTQSGVVEGKEWYTAEDEHVCPFCDHLDHQVYGLGDNLFNKGDTLTVGDQSLNLSYDDVPSPPLHPNCRCVLLPVRS